MSLLLERCADCGRRALPGRGFCPACGAVASALEAPGEAEVTAVTLQHRAPSPSPLGVEPFHLVLARLLAAPEVTAMAVSARPRRIGERVRLRALEAPGRAPYAAEDV